jgi:Protein of unknown function (DUF2892)
MKPNVGGIDRTLRIVIGLALIVIAFLGYVGFWGYVVGGIALATGVFSRCGLYKLIGMSTCPLEASSPKAG